MVTVKVIKAFQHEGRSFRPGDGITVEPVVAAALSFRGVVSLNEPYRETAEVAPDAPIIPPVHPTQARRKRTRKSTPAGTYRRRDMRAEDPT